MSFHKNVQMTKIQMTSFVWSKFYLIFVKNTWEYLVHKLVPELSAVWIVFRIRFWREKTFCISFLVRTLRELFLQEVLLRRCQSQCFGYILVRTLQCFSPSHKANKSSEVLSPDGTIPVVTYGSRTASMTAGFLRTWQYKRTHPQGTNRHAWGFQNP